MRKLVVCLLPCLCLVAFAATSPFESLRTSVEDRIADIAGSADKDEMSEWKALTKALPYVVQAHVLEPEIPAPPTAADLADLLDLGALLPKAASNIEKSRTPDADILQEVSGIESWFRGFHTWLGLELTDILGALPAKDQAKIAVAEAKAQAAMEDGEDQWNDGHWGSATKSYLKAVKSLAKLLQKYSQ